MRAVDVVVAGDAGLEAEVLVVVAGHPLAEQLLPAVAVLGHGRVGVVLPQRVDLGRLLLAGRVDAGRRGVEEPLHARLPGRLEHVGGDQHRQHAQRLVVLDEAHAAHVGGEVVDHVDAVAGALARRQVLKVGASVVDVVEALVPLVTGTRSTPRMSSTPRSRRRATRWPPMKPPAPVTNTLVIGMTLPDPRLPNVMGERPRCGDLVVAGDLVARHGGRRDLVDQPGARRGHPQVTHCLSAGNRRSRSRRRVTAPGRRRPRRSGRRPSRG